MSRCQQCALYVKMAVSASDAGRFISTRRRIQNPKVHYRSGFPEYQSIPMTTIKSSGIEAGQRRLNGPQTTGREYRNLSQPAHAMTSDDDIEVPMRDGVTLLADVNRPSESGRYPVLVAASPYPRQIQNLGAP